MALLRFRGKDDAQEYHLGIASGLEETQADNRARAERRREARRSLVATCRQCGSQGLPFRAGGQLRCRSCRSDSVRVDARFVHVEHELPDEEDAFGIAHDPIARRRFESGLRQLDGRMWQVIAAIAGYDLGPCLVCKQACRGGIPFGACDNYSVRIGRWLGISPTAVAQYRRRGILAIQSGIGAADE